MRRGIRPLVVAASVLYTGGCVQVVQYGLQHSIGARLGPCQPAKDSVAQARGKPYRRYFSDEEDIGTGAQVFWHEWAYRLPADGGEVRKDSVTVVGYRWGDGVVGCDVRERTARVPGAHGSPWEGAGDLPAPN